MSLSNPMSSPSPEYHIEAYFKRNKNLVYGSCARCDHCFDKPVPIYDSTSEDPDDIRSWGTKRACWLLESEDYDVSQCPGVADD